MAGEKAANADGACAPPRLFTGIQSRLLHHVGRIEGARVVLRKAVYLLEGVEENAAHLPPAPPSRVGVPFRALGKAARKRGRVLELASVFADPLVFGDEVASEETPAGHPNATRLDVNSRQLRPRKSHLRTFDRWNPPCSRCLSRRVQLAALFRSRPPPPCR